MISVWWKGRSVDCYTPAINFVPESLETPELYFEVLLHDPGSKPGYYDFIIEEEDVFCPKLDIYLEINAVSPKRISDILNSSELFIKALKQIGMPDKYTEDAMKYFEKIKTKSP